MSGESELEQERAEERHLERIHKAEPGRDLLHCGICGQWIRKVPGGSGPVWVHADSGAVAAPNPPLTDAVMSEVVNGLITKPERYVTSWGSYADGYLDALLDLLAGLGLFRPDPAYQLLREQISRLKAAPGLAYWQAQAEAMRRQEHALREQPEQERS